MSVTIRVATPQDAEPVASLGREFVAYLQSLGDSHPNSLTVEDYLRDGFSENPAFAGLIAELEGQIVGYLLYCPAYDLDLGGRILYIIDLFVREAARRRGVGRALMTRVADICREQGGQALLWSVYSPNKMAAAFYQKFGAQYIKELNFMYWSV
jgi:GNAT superfamily N-acetyltransferase